MSDKRTIITIAGDLGSGKSTVAKIISTELGYERFSTGDIQRNLAREKGLTSLELNKLAETHPEIDAQIDANISSVAESHSKIIVDSRLAWHFLPASFKVYLTVDPLVACSRIMAAERGVEERYSSAEEACAKLAERRESEDQRFKALYHADMADFDNYDIVVDTTHSSPDEVAARIIEQYAIWQRG